MKKSFFKKSMFSFCILFLGISVLFAGGVKDASSSEKNGKLTVVTTIFPEYDWVKNIAGDKINLTLLMDQGTDMHSWQPSSADIVKVSSADIFIYVGGESDKWVPGALSNSVNKKQIAINLMEVLKDTIREEEVVEGMQAEEEESESESDEIEYDEHVWLSVRNAKAICKNITEILCSIDSVNAQFYRSNNEDYSKKLNVLDENYTDAVKTAARQVVLFGDRFPFRYLIDDYSITYYAAFAGCSAETEASFKTITFLVSKVDELNLPAVLVLENSNKKIADTIIQNTKKKNQEILVLDSMQSTTKKQIADGKNYLGIMADNLAALKKALN